MSAAFTRPVRHGSPLGRALPPWWWLRLVGGIALVLLGLWAAGDWDLSAALLVAGAAVFALIRGFRDIVTAFRLREIQHPHPAHP